MRHLRISVQSKLSGRSEGSPPCRASTGSRRSPCATRPCRSCWSVKEKKIRLLISITVTKLGDLLDFVQHF